MIWLIADTHFGHKLMVELCGRPENFERLIQEKVLSLVAISDTLIHLGDICFGRPLPADYWFGHCRKVLIRGNHDQHSLVWYEQHGWDMAVDALGLNMYGKKILLTHRPAQLGDFDLNIHGHCHNISPEQWVRHQVVWGLSHRLFALEYTNYAPVSLRTAVQKGLPTGPTVEVDETLLEEKY
jgi:calcineurin-like phosphoesterase family protein